MKTFQQLKLNLKEDFNALRTIKVALLGDTATQFLVMALKGDAIERMYNLELFEAEYNQVERQVMELTSELYQFEAEFVIVFQSTHKFLNKFNKTKIEERMNLANERLTFIETMCQSISANIIYYNYPEIDDGVFGNLANQIEESFIFQTRKLNYELMMLAKKYPNLYVCDLSSVQNKIGRDFMFDASIYISTEMVLSIDSLPLVASRTMDLICAHKGNFKKCLILDLDNTLWGGVIGDDGIENISLGHGLGIGKAFTEFQEWIKKLKERGIILAICSKNTEPIAREPFEKHPEMVLRLDDISVFMANWDNKADNIRQIQIVLNIGFDSMVFLDDNPFERNMVKTNVPDICIPELPEDPADYLEFLYGLNLFETVSYIPGDKERTRQYQVESQRVLANKQFTNEDDFLKSLEMISAVEGFTKFNIPRVAQLSQRSNQFNLRTIRYTESDIENVADNPDYCCLSFTLEDKFGDNGLICVVILKKQSIDTLFIETWLMSCRVLKRGLENFTLNTILKYARSKDYKKVIGEYLPTPKNSMVADHYEKLGFKPVEDTVNQFIIDVNRYQSKKCHIQRR